jgi:O-antigen/teichoic acid export membrane protein
MTYTSPVDLKTSDEKWLRIFSKKAFISVAITSSLGFVIFKFFNAMGYFHLGLLFLIIPVLVVFGITTIKVPDSWHLNGAGLTLDIMLFRLYVRHKNRVIYIKGYRRP